MKTLARHFVHFAALVLVAWTAAISSAPARAGDQADSPLLANDPAADIGDVFAFLDPGDNTRVILIATVHPYIIPGQMLAVGFDDTIQYRFEIYNDHVNVDFPVFDSTQKMAARNAYLARIKPKLTIDVTFSKRQVGESSQTNGTGGSVPRNLREAPVQSATLRFTGFKDPSGAPLLNKGVFPAPGESPLLTTPVSTGTIASNPNTPTFLATPTSTVQFFAGIVDDPFFFDQPAFNAFLDSIRAGTPTTFPLSRGRDTFAGYNTLAIALSVPASLLVGTNGPRIGVDFLTQRHLIEHFSKGLKATGPFETVDRMGHPLVTSVLVPFDLRDAYNAATPKADASLLFVDEILETLTELGLNTQTLGGSFNQFMNMYVAKGDLLQLDTTTPNSGTNAPAAYPNGRRVTDDVVDTFLTLLNFGTPLTDSVPTNDSVIPTVFPFLALPHQPLYNTNNADDGTRN